MEFLTQVSSTRQRCGHPMYVEVANEPGMLLPSKHTYGLECCFLERSKISNIDFIDWIKQEYNAEILNSSFKSRIEWERAAIDLMEFSNAKNKC